MKKLFALLLCFALLFSLSVTAMAEDYAVGEKVTVSGDTNTEPAGSIPDNSYWAKSAGTERVLNCSEADHSHEPLSCFMLICQDAACVHNEACYDQTQLECDIHVHAEPDCYTDGPTTVWTLTEKQADTINIVVNVASNSALSADEIGDITLSVSSTDLEGNNNSLTEKTFPAASGTGFEAQDRILSLFLLEDSLKRDGYKLSFSIDTASLEAGHAGYEHTVTISLDYWQEATIVLKKSFADGSLLNADPATLAPETTVTLGGSTVILNSANQWEQALTGTFRAGQVLTVSQSLDGPTGFEHKSSLDEAANQSVTLQSGENIIEIEDYFYLEESFTFKVEFTGELDADDFPDGIDVSASIGTYGSVNYFAQSETLDASNNWEAVFTLPAGWVNWAISSIEVGNYELVSDQTGTYANAGDSSLTVPLNYERKYNDITVKLYERAYLIENGTLTETTVRSTGFERSSYNVTLENVAGTGTITESCTLAGGQQYTFSLPQGDTYRIKVTPGYYHISVSRSDVNLGDEAESVDVYITYYYQEDTAPLAISGRVIDATSGKALSGAGISFTPPANEGGAVGSTPGTAQTGSDGAFSFPISFVGNYTLAETAAPKGYELNSTPVTVTLTETWAVDESEGRIVITQVFILSHDGAVDDGGNLVIKNTLLPTVDVGVEVKFVRDSTLQRPEKVTVVLYKDGVEYNRVTLTAKDNWYYKWEKLPGGYYYTADETAVPEGYIKYFVRNKNDITIVNSGTDIPVTGDDNALLWGALAMLMLTGCAVLIRFRKKFQQ